MKYKFLIQAVAAAIIASGISTPAFAADNTAAIDKPDVKILFNHTAENPYDIRLLSYLGGMACRVEIVPRTQKTIVVAYNTGDLHGAKITGAAPTTIGFRVCKNGKKTVLFDLLSVNKRSNPLPAMVTRLSNVQEWKAALVMQQNGVLNTRTFAHTAVLNNPRGEYASNPVSTARQNL